MNDFLKISYLFSFSCKETVLPVLLTGVKLSGFPGVLLLATQGGLISAEELRTRLEICREKGTHYRTSFIQQVYEMAKQSRN